MRPHLFTAATNFQEGMVSFSGRGQRVERNLLLWLRVVLKGDQRQLRSDLLLCMPNSPSVLVKQRLDRLWETEKG